MLISTIDIGLTRLVPNLDTTATELVKQQKDALVERKDLAQKTKDFRKLEDAAKLTETKGLLKAYQTYIDLITNQSKTIHNSFLHVYSLLSEAPDPYPLLEASVDSLVTVEEIVPKIEAENKHLQKTVSKLTSQVEDTEARLHEETKLRRTLQEQSDDRVKAVEESWSAVLVEKQDNWSAKEKSLEERAENQDRLLKELKANYEVSQRLDHGADSPNAGQNTASVAELEILSSDLERANLRLAEVEARNEQMRLELAQNATSTGVAARPVSVEDDPAYIQLRSENTSLMRKIEAARFERESDTRELDTQMRSLKREMAGLAEDRDSLKAKIHKWSDYEDLRRELEVLRSIEFSAVDDDETAEDGESTEGQGMKADGQALEKLLMARNKKLNNDLTELRVSRQDISNQLDLLRSETFSNHAELDHSRQLIANLENDLTNLQQEASSGGPAMSVAGTYTSRHPTSSHVRRGGRASPTSSIISGFDSSRGFNIGDAVGGGSGMLPMITAQRDRFKRRITDLETDNSKAHNTISSLRSEITVLQKDNLNLYEKTRYVSTYSDAQSAAGANLNPNPSTVNIGENGGPMDRYKSAYESRISPFAVFRGHESMRAMKRMSLPERAFLQTTKVVLQNRISRNVFAVYFLCLHMVLITMLYHHSGGSNASMPGALPKVVDKKSKDENTT